MIDLPAMTHPEDYDLFSPDFIDDPIIPHPELPIPLEGAPQRIPKLFGRKRELFLNRPLDPALRFRGNPSQVPARNIRMVEQLKRGPPNDHARLSPDLLVLEGLSL